MADGPAQDADGGEPEGSRCKWPRADPRAVATTGSPQKGARSERCKIATSTDPLEDTSLKLVGHVSEKDRKQVW